MVRNNSKEVFIIHAHLEHRPEVLQPERACLCRTKSVLAATALSPSGRERGRGPTMAAATALSTPAPGRLFSRTLCLHKTSGSGTTHPVPSPHTHPHAHAEAHATATDGRGTAVPREAAWSGRVCCVLRSVWAGGVSGEGVTWLRRSHRARRALDRECSRLGQRPRPRASRAPPRLDGSCRAGPGRAGLVARTPSSAGSPAGPGVHADPPRTRAAGYR